MEGRIPETLRTRTQPMVRGLTHWLDSTLGFVLTGTGLIGLVMLRGLAGPFYADNRFTLFLFEATVGSNPLGIVNYVITLVPAYLQRGNFRPLSRIQYGLEYWALFKTTYLTGIPGHVLHAIPKLVVLAALLWVLNTIINQYAYASEAATNGYWKVLRWVLVVALGCLLVLRHISQHPMMLFPGLYVGGVVVALALVALVGRTVVADRAPRGLVILGAVLGAMIAMIVELAYVAIPLVVGHLVLLLVSRHGWKALPSAITRSAGFGMASAVIGGFSVVFVPTRIMIARLCSDGSCYAASAPGLDDQTLEALGSRLASPLLMVGDALERQPPSSLGNRIVAAYAVVVCALGFLLIAQALTRRSTKGGAVPDAWYLPGILALGAWFFGATFGALSEGVDAGRITAWRDTAIIWPAAALLLAVLAARLMMIRRLPGLVIAALIAVILSAPVRFNDRTVASSLTDQRHVAHMRIDSAMARFDSSSHGRAYRCRLLTDLVDAYEEPSSGLDSTLLFVQRAAQNAHGEPFCPGSPEVAEARRNRG